MTLYDVVLYDHKKFSELSDPDAQSQIISLITKLKPLEEEIIKHPNGNITIMPSGNIFTTGFPENIGAEITKIITGK